MFSAGSGLFGHEGSKSATRRKIATAPFAPKWRPKGPLPSIPPQKPKSVYERIAEADALRGEVSDSSIEEIKRTILDSARDFGEIPTDSDPVVWQIQAAVAAHFRLMDSDVRGRRRFRRVALPRHIAMYLARLLTSLSLTEIGRQFSGQDHTTVHHGIQKIERLIAADAGVAADVAALRGVLVS